MTIHPAGLLYVAAVGLLLPFVATRSARQLEAMPEPPSLGLMARSAFVTFAFLGLASWATARAIGIPWAVVRPPSGLDALYAAGALALLLAHAPFSWRTRPARERARLVGMLPRTPAQGAVWILVSLGAGIFEEIAWRGVLYANVLWLVHSPWLAAVLCSASFGVAHAYQGRRNMLTTGLIALLMHALVALAGSLLPAMAVHFVYDAIAGFLFRELARRDAASAPAAG